MADISATFSSLSSTESSNQPQGSTNVGTGLDDNLRMLGALLAAWRDQTAYGILTLTSVSGTNTITATLASAGSVSFGPLSYLTGAKFLIVPANTNTGATTLNITSPNGGSALGAKNVFWNGAACVGGELRQNIPAIVEYDGTQFHVIANGFNAPFLDTHPVAQGSADSTKKVRLEVDGLTTATTRVLTVRDADFDVGAATQAEQETGSIVTASVTPGRQQYHPSACKAWVQYDQTGTLTSSYNLTSITDNGVGNLSPVWNVDFSSANYTVLATAEAAAANTSGTTFLAQILPVGRAAGGCNITTLRISDFAATDVSYVNVAAFGDQ